MPYTTDNPPDRINGLPKHGQEIWIAAYNAAIDQYDGDEGKANAVAWAAVKKEYEQDADGKWKKKTSATSRAQRQRGEIIALSVDPAALRAAPGDSSGSAERKSLVIQVLRGGDFVDMHEQDVPIKDGDLDDYVSNSNALLAKEEVPVELGHPDDPGAPAAAWYRKFFKKVIDSVDWVCAEIELSALGAQSLADQLYKYFSASLDLDAKAVVGGGFVNRPAIAGQQTVGSLSAFLHSKPKGGENMASKNHKNGLQTAADLLKRALGIAQLEISQEDLRDKIYWAIEEKFGNSNRDGMYDTSMPRPYPIATFDDHVIVQKGEHCFSIPYTIENDEVKLGDPVEVEVTYTPKQSPNTDAGAMMSAPTANPLPTPAALALASKRDPAPGGDTPSPSQGGESNMGNQANPTTPAPVPAPPINPPEPAPGAPNGSFEAQLAAARSQVAQEYERQLGEFDRALAAARVQERERVQTEMQRKQDVALLAAKVTSGKHAFPQTVTQIEELLLKLTDSDRQLVSAFLEQVHESGMVEFGERGHARPGQGFKPLPDYAKPLLQVWLSKGGTAEEFFAANVELGKADLYDLSEFEKK